MKATVSPRRARNVGPNSEPLYPQVAVVFPATNSAAPAAAISSKWRVPLASIRDSAMGGIGNCRNGDARTGSFPPPLHPANITIGVAARPVKKCLLDSCFTMLLGRAGQCDAPNLPDQSS